MPGRSCKCGCGQTIKSSKKYADKEHQLRHMRAGEASRLNSMQPIDAKKRGGAVAGRAAVVSGRLLEAGRKGAAKAAAVAEALRESA